MIFTPFQLSTLITALVSFFFGVVVYSRERRSKTNLFWLLTSLSITTWSIGLFGVVFSEEEKNAWFWQHILDIGGVLIPILYFNFILYLLNRKDKISILRIFSWLTGVILLALSFTRLFKTGVSPKLNLNYWIDPGRLYFLFPLVFVLLVILSTFLLIKERHRTSDNILKRQITHILFAQIVGFGGGVTNFFPQLFNVYPFGNYLVVFYIIFISYAALRHHLFDIRVIATELLTFGVWIFLIVRTLLSDNLEEFVINGGMLVAIIFLGTLLMRSVVREVEQKEELARLNKEIEAAYAVEKKAKGELEKLDAAKTQFIMATQHHLRTPLTAMRGYLDLLLTGSFGKISERVRVTLEKIDISTKRLIRIVNEILDISQFQLGKEVVRLQPRVDVEKILEEMKEDLDIEIATKGLYFKCEKPEGPLPKISADPEKFKVAIYNIVDNAIKYTQKGGITVSVKTTDSNLQIAVKDTGIGMSEASKEKLFKSYFQRGEEAEKTFKMGRGIGMYITYQIIQAHKGRMWAESEGEGKGSTFYIELPVG